MTMQGLSRRGLGARASALVALAGFFAGTRDARAEPSADVVRAWYHAWDVKDWSRVEALSTADFNFTSPNDDDHIPRSTFKTRCWDPNVGLIKTFQLELVMADGNDVLVKYTCQTTNGHSFSNVEYFHLRDGRIASLRCFFGGKMTYPAAVSRG